MPQVADKIAQMGLVLPQALEPPAGLVLPFPWVNVRGDTVYVSGHGPQNEDGSVAGPFGQVGGEVSLDDAVGLARKAAVAMLASLQRELGDLDRITSWNRVFGMVNTAPGFDRQPLVINGFSELILEVFGPEVGRHARSAVGLAGLPFSMAVEIEAEVTITA
jgi:enamine deaminase RidA (YjgF/YER057c/UK114 family)